MNKRYTFKLNSKLNIALYVLLAILIVGIIGIIVSMTMQLMSDETPNITASIISLVLAIIVFGFTLSLKVFLFYSLSSRGLKLIYLFPIKKIMCDDILFIRESVAENLVLLYHKIYTNDGEELISYIALCIQPKQVQDFFETVKLYNPKVIFESFDNVLEEMENNADDNQK